MSNIEDLDEARTKRAEAKEKERRAKLDESAAALEEMMAAAAAFLKENPFYYTQKQNCYLRKNGSDWVLLLPASMREMFSAWSDIQFRQCVSTIMEDESRKFLDITYTLRDPPPGVLNLMSRESWAQPLAGESHWFFDALMTSVSGDKRENRDHVEQLIAHKWSFPDEFLLPSLMIHGEGGVGKNVLVDNVLHCLFGGATVSATAAKVLGDFNSLVKGKVVLLLDEATAEKIGKGKEELKNRIGAPRIALNEKHIREYVMDNFLWIIISSNDSEGGVFLDKSEADRRYSVCHAEKGTTLISVLADSLQCSKDEARNWMTTEGTRISKDREEVGKWIRALCDKWQPRRDKIPPALHGADYQRLVGIQSRTDERICRAVFLSEDDEEGKGGFTHIRGEVLKQGYELGGGKVESSIKFHTRVKEWLAKHAPHVEMESRKVPIGPDGERRQVSVYVNTNRRDEVFVQGAHGKPAYTNNDFEYIKTHNYRDKWVGPEF